MGRLASTGLRARIVVVIVGCFCASPAVPAAAAATPGTQLWVTRYDDPSHQTDSAYSMTVNAKGSKVFVTGRQGGTGGDYATVAYAAATGDELWASAYNGPGSGNDTASSIAVGGGRVFVTGRSWGGQQSGYDYATVAYAASTGARLWVRRYNGGNDAAWSIAVAGGQVFVTGTSTKGFATVAYSASTGTSLWAKRYNAYSYGYRDFLAVGPDGSKVFVTGSSFPPGNVSQQYATVAYAGSTGDTLWVRRFSKFGGDASSIALSPSGGKVFVTGGDYPTQAASLNDHSAYGTVAYAASTGNLLWARHYIGPLPRHAEAKSIAIGPSGSKVFVTGWSETSSGVDYATVAYTASTGNRLWVARHKADGLLPVAVRTTVGSVFVAGTSGGDYVTLSYLASSGTQLWASSYNGPGNGDDIAWLICVGSDGSSVFVTGGSVGSGTGSDIATVAYAV